MGVEEGQATAASGRDPLAVDAELVLAAELGAHFVLFKPLSLERTRSSFRAVRALMKRERRRHARIPIELPAELQFDSKQGSLRTVTSDVSDGGCQLSLRVEVQKDSVVALRVIERRMQAQDHPVLLTVPETLYLKCLILEVI